MRVDIAELNPDGTVVSILPGVDLAEAVPDVEERADIRHELGRHGETMIGGGAAPLYRLSLARRLPAGLRPARIRLRIHPKPIRPAPVDPVARRIAAVMAERAGADGACTVRDLRHAGFSYRQIVGAADAAREILGRAAA